ncbi:uncharacterized protein LOC125672587 isoform X4 [Ostrea edulis]|nr:uncharacterized protein LOC125672587 isoform X4 [Ostrea edulis]XP_056020713.1 uncharacterized protein LOC125672587 isoform X4 [Ostrea edulis]XP_056020719.1 uncharacterized protein LOC125672587 isoform X4 [Ostrea edulis]XP_056020725.1 uncharacterized protein LOC125672587 isoform X4 [Ostrea edulis]
MSNQYVNDNQVWTDSPRSDEPTHRGRRHQQVEINVEITPHPRKRAPDQLDDGLSTHRGNPGTHRSRPVENSSRNQYIPSQFTHEEGRGSPRVNITYRGDPRGPRGSGKHYGEGHSYNHRSSPSSHTDSVDSLKKASSNKNFDPAVQYVIRSKANSRASSTSKAPDPSLSEMEKHAPADGAYHNSNQKVTNTAQYLDNPNVSAAPFMDEKDRQYQQKNVKIANYVQSNTQHRYVDENSDSTTSYNSLSQSEQNGVRNGKSVQFTDEPRNNDMSRTSNPQGHLSYQSEKPNNQNLQTNINGQKFAPNQPYSNGNQPMQNSDNVTSNKLNQEYQFPDSEDEDDGLDLNDIDSVYEGNDAYVCYLMTDDGGMAGPLRLDINDVQVGLPSEVKVKENNSGMRNRQTGSHGLNEFSSRSHSMLTLTIDTEQQDPDDDNLYLTKRGKLTFVDLAGSEKVKDSESTDQTLKESNNINRSLLVLGNCISSLGDAKKRQGHIPYRDSKLTKLLADSLGGNGVTLMIACVTPSSHHIHETINTLRYASRAKKIKTKPIVKMDPREKLILSLKREIKILRNENIYLRQQLEFPAKPKGDLQKSNDEKFMKFLKTQGKESNDPKANAKGGTEAGLYEMLQEYMIENEALRSENSEMHQTKDKIKREQQLMYRENERLSKKIEQLERDLYGRQPGGGAGGWQRQTNGPPPQRQTNGPPPQRQVNGPPPARQQNGPPPPQHPPPDQYYDQGPPPRQGINKPPPPPPNNQWKSTPPQRPVNNRVVDQYIPGPSPQAGRGKQSTPPSGPKRPPHRLADPIGRPNLPPEYIQNGVGGYPDDGYMSPRGRPSPLHNGPLRQGAANSSLRELQSRRFLHFSANHLNRQQMHKIGRSMPNLSSREIFTADVGFDSESEMPYVRKIRTALDIFYDEDDDILSSRIESPHRYNDSRRASQVSTSDSIRSMNAKLKQEIYELEGEIEHHHHVNQRTKSVYGSQTSVRSGPR